MSRFAGAHHPQRKGDIVVDIQMRIQGVALENHGHIALPGRMKHAFARGGHDLIFEPDFTVRRFFQAGHQIQKGALAAAAGSQQNKKFTRHEPPG